MIFRQRLKRIVILKARQLGFSTLLGIICTDNLCWTTGKQLSLIDRTKENARQKLRVLSPWPTIRLTLSLRRGFLSTEPTPGNSVSAFMSMRPPKHRRSLPGPTLVAGRTRSFGFRSGVMCNAKTFAAPKKFSRAPSRVQRTGP